MAKFIEYKSNPSWTTLFRCCWGGVIPLLAVILFIQGVVSTIGLVLIVACLIGVLFFLNEQVKRREARRGRTNPLQCTMNTGQEKP